MIGSAGDDVIRGDHNDNIIEGGAGNDQLAGSGGDDAFVFGPGFDHDTIADFDDRGDDAIEFSQNVFADFAEVEAALSTDGADVVITVGDDNASIRLLHTSLASLTADDFRFV